MTNTNEHNDITNDPRLTAYALGELEGAERAEVEALVAKDENARRVVEEIRATATLVTAELGTAGGPALTDEQRAKIAAKAAKPVASMRRFRWIAAAASVAAAATIVASTSAMRGNSAPETAKVEFEESIRLHNGEGWENASEEPVPGAASAAFTAAGGSGVAGDLVPADGARGGLAGDVYSEGGGGGGGGELRVVESIDAVQRGAGAFNPDPNAPANQPSDATGGTSIGVGGKPSAWVGRRAGGGGAGGGGLGQAPRRQPAASPKPGADSGPTAGPDPRRTQRK